MIALDLCQAHYQILSITYLKDFTMISAVYKSCLDYMSVDEQRNCIQLIFRCFECKKNYKKDFNKELIKRLKNINEFCNKDNKFIL